MVEKKSKKLRRRPVGAKRRTIQKGGVTLGKALPRNLCSPSKKFVEGRLTGGKGGLP